MLKRGGVRSLKEILPNPLRLLDHQGFVKYSKNALWPLLEKALRIVLGISVGVWTARYLGPGDFGILSYVQSLIALASVLTTLGLEGIMTKELAKYPQRRDALLGSSFVLQTAAAVLSFALIASATFLIGDEKAVRTLILVHATLFFSLNTQGIFCYFQSNVQMKYAICPRIGALLITKGIQIFLVVSKQPLSSFVVVLTLEFIINAVFLLFAYGAVHRLSPLRWTFEPRLVLLLLRNSWPLMISDFVLNVYTKIDQVMLKGLLDSQAVGLYAAATKVSLSCCLIPPLITTSLFPAIVRAKSVGEEAYLFRVQKLYDFTLLLSIGIAIPIAFFSQEIVDILYGDEFGGSARILAIHILCGLFLSATSVRYIQLINEDLQRYDLLLHCIGASCNVLFNFFFIRLYGTIGAAYGTVLSYSFSFLATGILIKKVRPSFFMILRSYANAASLKFLKKDYYRLK